MESQPEQHVVKILAVENVTHNVKRFTLSKPEGYFFTAGQATEISINKPGWETEGRPFTFTSLNHWPDLEFTIKIYNDHDGVTNELGTLKPGDELIVHDVFGAIHYVGEGTFIAGGAGVTPFIAILRQLKENGNLGNNRLLFSNRTAADIILQTEFSDMLNGNFINTLTDEKHPAYDNRRIDKDYLKEKIQNKDQYFYICGPDPMVLGIREILVQLDISSEKIVTEEF